MSKITLPPLPEPDIWVREDFGLGDSTVHQGYTAEQMQERDRQIAEHVIRACAEVAQEHADAWKNRPVPLLGYTAVLEDCGAAILALLPVKEPT